MPNRPHLIVVPNTLIPQWKHSLTCWLKQGSADVLVYAEGKQSRNEFWATNGPYESSLFKKSGELHHMIILASKEVIYSIILGTGCMFNLYYRQLARITGSILARIGV